MLKQTSHQFITRQRNAVTRRGDMAQLCHLEVARQIFSENRKSFPSRGQQIAFETSFSPYQQSPEHLSLVSLVPGHCYVLSRKCTGHKN
jgi:hypothetical protein